jgi:hypothetical protein
VVPGLDRRTLARWRAWWRSTFTDTPFAAVAKAAVAPPIDIAALPVSLLDRFAGDLRGQLIALLRFLGPLTGGASWAERAFGTTCEERAFGTTCEERAFGASAMHAF